MLKLNMGCGRRRLPGFVNVDAVAACEPDQVVDLEQTPWPWADSSVAEVMFRHSLEHMGGDAKVFLAIMSELYRVCAPDAVVEIWVPHHRHDDFINDPTHVRAITPTLLTLFDRSLCDEWVAVGGANTPLAHYLGVDFRITQRHSILDEPYAGQFERGEISSDQVGQAIRSMNNVVKEQRIKLVVKK